MRILVLGVGLQGRAALQDLARSPEVTHVLAADQDVAGVSRFVQQLNSDKIEIVDLDARDSEKVSDLLRQVDCVVELLPVRFHVPITRLAIGHGVHVVNASYSPPEFTSLGREAESRGLTILPEFGFDPGIDLLLLGEARREFDEVQQLYTYGAGFPEPAASNNPLRYKISWTFEGVLKAYMRDSRIVRDGQVTDIPGRELFAPANIHSVELEWGSFEAYPNGNVLPYLEALGLRANIRNAGRYALRWAGHAAFWYPLVQLGFLDDAPFRMGPAEFSPREFVCRKLEPQLQYGAQERDIALIRIELRGLKHGRHRRIVYEVVDYRDLETGLFAMNRTVGYTASIGAQMILRGDIAKRGLLSPLTDVPADLVFGELGRRGIHVRKWDEED